MLKVLYERYYTISRFDSFIIRCNAETITKSNMFLTDKPSVVLNNVDARNDEYARSGNYSVRLTPERPYGFTYKINDLNYGDVIKVGVWKHKGSGKLIVMNKNGFFLAQSNAYETDSRGWQHLWLNIIVKDDMDQKEVRMFVYNTSQDTSYFDDMEISFDRWK